MNAGLRTHTARSSAPLLFGNESIDRRVIWQVVVQLGWYLSPGHAWFTGSCDVNWANVASASRVTQTHTFLVCTPQNYRLPHTDRDKLTENKTKSNFSLQTIPNRKMTKTTLPLAPASWLCVDCFAVLEIKLLSIWTFYRLLFLCFLYLNSDKTMSLIILLKWVSDIFLYF